MEEKQNSTEVQPTEHQILTDSSKKMKRLVITVFACILGVILVMMISVWALQHFFDRQPTGSEDETYEFYPSPEGDISENTFYMEELDRQVYYCNDPNGYGITEAIDRESREDYPSEVLFLYDYIQTVIQGDSETYNACFNSVYYRDNVPKAAFSQQMLYNIRINYLAQEQDGADRLVTYRLSYMIYQNDGTFRRDVGSDAARPQDITVRVEPNGQISVERMVTRYAK